jgi:hypothetical protein
VVNEEDKSHAVAQQLTCIKQLYEIKGFHAETFANLLGTVKETIKESLDRFQHFKGNIVVELINSWHVRENNAT